ncbi:hypothetical protein RHMOL_Rhmol05G0133800 [Rhododendron molle]|uniref:Uncharacterized protein n=1 Tax=Rhododendron molle TaxID=49168 RepID=A0ACC0NNF0_RHOML|nr:hypothetical protein RHMOL_Rhmol05G0133800 [Rhododendron molle]
MKSSTSPSIVQPTASSLVTDEEQPVSAMSTMVGEDPQEWGMPFFGLNQKLHLQHHVAVVVEVAVPQCQALNHQVQPQVPKNQPLETALGNGLG